MYIWQKNVRNIWQNFNCLCVGLIQIFKILSDLNYDVLCVGALASVCVCVCVCMRVCVCIHACMCACVVMQPTIGSGNNRTVIESC